MVIAETIVINIAYTLLLLSFIFNNLYIIRILSIMANIVLLIWGALFFNYPECISLIVWPGVFISINIGYLIKYKYYSEPPDTKIIPV
jgi:hypothetical protein